MSFTKQLNFRNIFFRYIVGAGVLSLLLAAGLYAYLGSFSRYGGDDYCEAARIRQSSPFAAVFERYFFEDWPRATMRYSNLLFVGFSELLGSYSMPVTMASMVVLWFAGTVWGTYELRKLLNIHWDFLLDLFVGLTFGFFSLRQAPNLLETVYWRSAMMTHFAPLVFGSFLCAFLLRQARTSEGKSYSLPAYLLIIAVTFVIAGFSEPPTTTLLTVTVLLMAAVWIWDRSRDRRKHLALLASVFAGALLALAAMVLSPATAGASQERTFNIFSVLLDSFRFSYQFMVDSLRTQPLPIFSTLLITLTLVWLHRQMRPSELSYMHRRVIWIGLIAAPILAWLLIAAGFSPSAYGQSFPVERSRFLARALLIAVFMLEGAFLGLLLGHLNLRRSPMLGQTLFAVIFAALAVGYPLRTAASLLRLDLPEYRERAQLWDARDAYIREMKENGVRDLTVPFLSSEILQDLGDRSGFRLNRCASVLYGVDSIVARPMSD